MTPTIPITLSLISVTTFFVVFILFSLAFRSELTLDVAKNANIFALNILESDREKIEKVLSGAEMYSILRAKISLINGKTLAEHLGTENPSGEFSREFNVTISPLQNKILK
jgi:predicted lysophospholipase L1 biosynthesis ABC-type transport system permease subunit